ncbi:hypothetical protein BDP81DRAFT_45198 [Colletotrichum phormii]|uniref:Secreted protein n=1 Tax=Colletotrichum phormii TaxID=359342 RepID=A0AAI9ZQR9_9PEZI|nr:uncharacterized protein BDP81DRAFT_45198 [Colletotrichum phormii]KAK1635099.1 hypothetical protein BDP81DRAFT_45198 [Colletotrichum phormii]
MPFVAIVVAILPPVFSSSRIPPSRFSPCSLRLSHSLRCAVDPMEKIQLPVLPDDGEKKVSKWACVFRKDVHFLFCSSSKENNNSKTQFI